MEAKHFLHQPRRYLTFDAESVVTAPVELTVLEQRYPAETACGTSPRGLITTDDPSDVTCRYCLEWIERDGEARLLFLEGL